MQTLTVTDEMLSPYLVVTCPECGQSALYDRIHPFDAIGWLQQHAAAHMAVRVILTDDAAEMAKER